MLAALRLTVGTFTVFPVRVGAADSRTAGQAMTLAPLVGVAVGGVAGGAAWVLLRLGAGPLLAAVLAVAVLALSSRALHLDGLADTADALGSGRPAEQALAVMKASDIGPFGVVTLVLVLLAQIAAVAQLANPVVGLAAAAATGRLAATWACRRGVPAARADGLGRWVAGSVGGAQLAGASVSTAVAAVGLAWVGGTGIGIALASVGAGVGAALLLLNRCVRRLGGITGDVLGALVETGTTVALVVLALN
jgi:adenosylcobinamide-GDP ribazoletransferase